MSAVNIGTPGDLYAEWRDDSRCEDIIQKKPYMRGAWDGPNEDGVSHPYYEQAEKECLKCPARLFCLQDALLDPEAQGIRGGYTFDGGRLPVAKAREIRDTTDLKLGAHQKTGRAKQ